MEQGNGKYNLPSLTAEEVKPSIFGLTQEDITGYREILAKENIDPAHPVSDPETLLSLNDTPILWRGCKSFVCAVAKARKTTALTLFASILLGRDETERGFKKKQGCKVLFLDTEQARYDSQKIFFRVAELTDRKPTELKTDFNVISLNKYDYSQIRGIMETAIMDFKPDVLMLDNWTDCVVSVLDEKDCTEFSKDLRAIAEVYNLAVFSVIHANEGDSRNDKPKFRGWAIEEARKSDLTLYLKDMSEVEDENLRGEYSRARFGKCRGKKPDDFCISIDDDGLPCLYTHEIGTVKNPDKYAPMVALIPKEGIDYMGLARAIKTQNGKISIATAKRRIKDMVTIGVVAKTGEGSNARYYKPEDTQQTPEFPF